MARRGKKSGRGRGRGRGQSNSGFRVNYPEIIKENKLYQEYYNGLGIIEQDGQETFWATLRRELPNSFRFTGSKGHALVEQKRLQERYIPEILKMDHYDGEKVDPPFQIPWYPHGLAWAMTTPKKIIRRYPPFAAFQKFLVSETSVGNISRQEVVSMIPPLLMDVQPHMAVLDMCAAPGSKAAQLIEMIHAGEESRMEDYVKMHSEQGLENEQEAAKEFEDHGRSTGLLIANDADFKRSYLLVHQMKRLNSPNMIVTNHDATIFPLVKLPGSSGADQYLKFDRILADVPCTGDGTPRKNPNVWKDWNPGNALALHSVQVRILVRALQMLKVGGRVVYSTCSMNPVENEAVVASVIDRCGGPSNVEILDCSNELTGLQRRPGLSQWSVMDKSGRIWSTWEAVEQQNQTVGIQGLGRLAESMFPPANHADTDRIALERCMRVYAHLQDTGAFFICVLEKRAEIKVRPESETKKAERRKERRRKAPDVAVAGDSAEKTAAPSETKVIDALHVAMPPRDHTIEDVPAVSLQKPENNSTGNELAKHALDDENADTNAIPDHKRAKVDKEADEMAADFRVDNKSLAPGAIDEEGAAAANTILENNEPEQQGESDDMVLGEGAEQTKDSLPALTARSDLPTEIAEADATPSSPDTPPRAGGKETKQRFEEPFKYLPVDHPDVQTITEFYDLSPKFPRDRFMVRNATGEPAKAIYYTAALVRDILAENEGRGVRFVNSGVRMFAKQDVQKPGTCKWRLQMEGLSLLAPWLGEVRTIRLYQRETLRTLLIQMFPRVNHDGWKDLGDIGERVRDISPGCCVLKVERSEGPDGFSEPMVLPLWRSLHSVNLMLAKEDRQSMLLRLFDDQTPLQHSTQFPPGGGSEAADPPSEAAGEDPSMDVDK
ncbi:MAG: hypothetical protein M1823_005889 [Watsoniomyces obsoletus]|nr:MAG: hypothetical protein M1823_005889 [Watsoniomyces obsoletus]